MAPEAYGVTVSRAIAEASALLSLAFIGTIAGGFLLTEVLRLLPLFPPPWNLLGLAPAGVGAGSLAYCGRFLSRRGRGTPYPRRPPRELVTTGPFRRVRNPIIISWGALLVGIAVAMNWTGLLLLLIPAAVIVHGYIVYREEPVLRRRFGPEYAVYRSRVPRWVPRLRR